jgi:lipopolysaccharide biosynthesis glycosyltransferase
MRYNIAIAFDQNYLQPFFALVTSIFHSTNPAEVSIHVIMTGVCDEDRHTIDNYINASGSRISYYSISDPQIEKFVTMNTWTTAVYYRLYFPLLVPDHVKLLLYLDTDTIVLNNLSQLFSQQMNGFPLAAVYDNYVKNQPLLGIFEEGQYFNSGVLLIDVEKWRAQKISEKAMEYLLKHPDRIRFVDQCGLNAVLVGNWMKLPSRFNRIFTYLPDDLSDDQMPAIINDTVVLHFTLERPWHMLCKNRFRRLYRKFLVNSPFRHASILTDFSIQKIPAWVRIRLVEIYNDNLLVKKLWRSIKLRLQR